MKVKLISYTPDALQSIISAARTCYRSSSRTEQDDKLLVKALIKRDHTPIEFAWTMWSIEGISRNCANQLNRYRLSSQAQESMRYVDVSKNSFVYPYSCLKVSDACQDIVDTCFKFYDKLVKSGVPKESARYFLPMGIETNLKIACNFRELRHILKQRLDKHAQWEVREVAKEMLAICQEKWPWLVEDLED